MSAGVCGKRLGYEEIFGSSSPSASAKRSRCSHFDSPVRLSDFGFGSEDRLSFLLHMFPTMDRELVETVLNTHDHKIDDAIKSLNAFCLGDVSVKNESLGLIANNPSVQDGENVHTSEKVEDMRNDNLDFESRILTNGSSWVDIFVQEMTNASDLDDARGRATKILEAFERSVIAHSRVSEEQQMALLKEQLQSLSRDNQILKRAVTIQYERNLEQGEKMREIQQLKHVISQYQEQVRTLELSNYTLNLHLQRAQGGSSISGHFQPDIF